MPAITPARTDDDLLGAPTPMHPGIESHLPLEPLDLPPMENMGYDQVINVL